MPSKAQKWSIAGSSKLSQVAMAPAAIPSDMLSASRSAAPSRFVATPHASNKSVSKPGMQTRQTSSAYFSPSSAADASHSMPPPLKQTLPPTRQRSLSASPEPVRGKRYKASSSQLVSPDAIIFSSEDEDFAGFEFPPAYARHRSPSVAPADERHPGPMPRVEAQQHVVDQEDQPPPAPKASVLAPPLPTPASPTSSHYLSESSHTVYAAAETQPAQIERLPLSMTHKRLLEDVDLSQIMGAMKTDDSFRERVTKTCNRDEYEAIGEELVARYQALIHKIMNGISARTQVYQQTVEDLVAQEEYLKERAERIRKTQEKLKEDGRRICERAVMRL